MHAHLRKAIVLTRLGLRNGRRLYRRVRDDAPFRDRMACVSAFAFIFVFFAASVDYLITGGPDWNPGAEAGELPVAYVQRIAVAPPEFPDAEAPPEQFQPIEFEDFAYSNESLLGGPETVLAVSYRPVTPRVIDAGPETHRPHAATAPLDTAPATPPPRCHRHTPRGCCSRR